MLRKWVKRYQEEGLQRLVNRSKRPRNSPNQKIDQQVTEWVLSLRKQQNLGAKRIQPELFRQHEYSIPLATIQRILVKHQASPIKELRRHKKFNHYQRPMPGDRIQVDTCKIAPGIYQYTAVDDCSRWRTLEIYKRRTATNTVNFIENMIEQFPFPIQRIQTDRGRC